MNMIVLFARMLSRTQYNSIGLTAVASGVLDKPGVAALTFVTQLFLTFLRRPAGPQTPNAGLFFEKENLSSKLSHKNAMRKQQRDKAARAEHRAHEAVCRRQSQTTEASDDWL